MAMEKTYIMLKPDCLKRGLMGEVIARIERKGYRITDAKMMCLDEAVLREHYAHIADKPFFPEIVSYMTSGPVFGMIVEGENAVKGMRILMAPPSLKKRLPVRSAGTMRSAPARTSSTVPIPWRTPRSKSAGSSNKKQEAAAGLPVTETVWLTGHAVFLLDRFGAGADSGAPQGMLPSRRAGGGS